MLSRNAVTDAAAAFFFITIVKCHTHAHSPSLPIDVKQSWCVSKNIHVHNNAIERFANQIVRNSILNGM